MEDMIPKALQGMQRVIACIAGSAVIVERSNGLGGSLAGLVGVEPLRVPNCTIGSVLQSRISTPS